MLPRVLLLLTHHISSTNTASGTPFTLRC